MIAGRHMLWDWMKSVNTHFERYNWLRMVSQDLDWEPIRRQHRRILEAIKRGDTDTASYLAETHLHLMPEEQGRLSPCIPTTLSCLKTRQSSPSSHLLEAQKRCRSPTAFCNREC